MDSDTNSSFINGVIAGAGVMLAVLSLAFVRMMTPLEGISGFTTTEVRVAMILGALVFVVSVVYEFYSRKKTKKDLDYKIDDKEPSEKIRHMIQEEVVKTLETSTAQKSNRKKETKENEQKKEDKSATIDE